MNSVKEFKEVEYKYLANDIPLSSFITWIQDLIKKESLNYIYKEASSSDVYFSNKEGEPLRFRNSQEPELTLKRKTSLENNEHRIEVNLKLNHDLFNNQEYQETLQAFSCVLKEDLKSTEQLVLNLSKKLKEKQNIEQVLEDCLKFRQYEKNFKIYKICEIYFIKDINFVYYSVLDKNLVPLDNFIEIEYSEHKARSLSAEVCLAELDFWEKKLLPLGLTKEDRLSNSLYERYKNKI